MLSARSLSAFLLVLATGAAVLPAVPVAAVEDAHFQIQPGALVETPVGFCSLNFVWRDAANNRYIGTAGHCVEGTGGPVWDIHGQRIGVVVFDQDGATDFALIRVDASRVSQVNPAVRHWGGPTGATVAAQTDIGDPVAFYGFGLGFELTEQTRARFGVLVSDGSSSYSSDMPAVNGDSGAAIIMKDSGLALGIVSHYGLPTTTDAGPTVQFIQSRLAAAGWSLTLMTAPLSGAVV